MGGSESIDFLAPAGAGENTLVTCEPCDYAADLEVARGPSARARRSPSGSTRPRRSRRRGSRRSRRSRASSGSTRAATAKAMPVVDAGSETRALLVRGDDRLDEARARGRARGETSGPRPRTRSAPASAPSPARSGPSGSTGPIVADETLRERPVRDRREPHRPAPARRRGGPGLHATLRRAARAARGRRVRALRRRACASRWRSRSATSSSSAPATRSRSRRYVPRRGRQRAPARDGLLRHRARPDHGRGGRAAPRRCRDRLATPRSRRTTCTWSRSAQPARKP